MGATIITVKILKISDLTFDFNLLYGTNFDGILLGSDFLSLPNFEQIYNTLLIPAVSKSGGPILIDSIIVHG